MKQTTKRKFNKNNLRKTPQTTGVYIFYDRGQKVIYVGKANNLRSRLSSYNLDIVTGKTKQMVSNIGSFSYIEVGSELESLLLEAKLVKKYYPKYNIQLKDDKHSLYIRITNEEFPRVITARRKDETEKGDILYGPFPSAKNVRTVLKILRRIFPYAQHQKKDKMACFYNQIGLCNPCPNISEDNKEYKRNIKMINGILSNKFNFVKKDLQKEIKILASQEKFEQAQEIKSKLDTIEYITQPRISPTSFLINPNFLEDVRVQELDELTDFISEFIDIQEINRIECYDVAHLQGTKPAASMVTFVDGEPEKSLYRHFKINQRKGNDDIASLKEVASRRIKHLTDWGVPDLVIVDGGKGQVGVFFKIFKQHNIPVVGLAKRFESLVFPIQNGTQKYVMRKVPEGNALNLVKRMRDEAHRFARIYHHKLIEKLLIPDK